MRDYLRDLRVKALKILSVYLFFYPSICLSVYATNLSHLHTRMRDKYGTINIHMNETAGLVQKFEPEVDRELCRHARDTTLHVSAIAASFIDFWR